LQIAPSRVAVVTGGSSGIGAAIARTLAEKCWQLVLLARNEERLRRVAEDVGAEHHVCDVGDREQVEEVAADVRGRHPAIRLLVNNAGIPGRGGGFLDMEPERIEELISINYLGSIWCLRAFLPALEAAAPADVVNVASVAGVIAVGESGPYSASKHAQLAFSRSVGVELAGGITVHSVMPGLIDTPGFPNRRRFRNAFIRRVVAEPELVAERVARAVDRGRVEQFVPRWYRSAAIVQAVAPASLARVARGLKTSRKPS
jgi:short-subunit dehydrogenase